MRPGGAPAVQVCKHFLNHNVRSVAGYRCDSDKGLDTTPMRGWAIYRVDRLLRQTINRRQERGFDWFLRPASVSVMSSASAPAVQRSESLPPEIYIPLVDSL